MVLRRKLSILNFILDLHTESDVQTEASTSRETKADATLLQKNAEGSVPRPHTPEVPAKTADEASAVASAEKPDASNLPSPNPLAAASETTPVLHKPKIESPSTAFAPDAQAVFKCPAPPLPKLDNATGDVLMTSSDNRKSLSPVKSTAGLRSVQ